MIENIRKWLRDHNLVGRRLYVLAGLVVALGALMVAVSTPKKRIPAPEATAGLIGGTNVPAKPEMGKLVPNAESSIQFSTTPLEYGITRVQQRQDETDKRIKEILEMVSNLAKKLDEPEQVPEGAVSRTEWNSFALDFKSLKDLVEPMARRFSSEESAAEGMKAEEDVRIIKVGKEREEPRSEVSPPQGKEATTVSQGPIGKPYYLPAASMAPGVLLNGVDAPPVAQAGAVTHPVLILVKAPFVAANNFKVSLEGCLVLGKAEGDLSSERVLVQLMQMACVFPGGRTLDRKINGYVSGQDGKMGIAGKVYDKRSRKLGMAILIGFTAGINQAMAQQEVTRIVTAEGTERTIVSGSAMTFGLNSGLQSALAEVTNFYREQMSRLFPIVAVPSGTQATLVVTEGVDIPEINNLYSVAEGGAAREQAQVNRK